MNTRYTKPSPKRFKGNQLPDITRQFGEAVETINNFMSGGKIGFYYDDRRYRWGIPAGVGIYTYGVSGIFEDIDDIREHGNNERILKKSLYEGQEFLYWLVKALSVRE